jgi:hypothetical protein
MLHWPTQIALLGAILLFVHRLPALGSLLEAMLAGCLAVGAVWVLNAGVARRQAEEMEHEGYAVPVLAETEA